MDLTVGFSLRQFSEVFKIRDENGNPYVLIGGQAVNYWAERYLPVEPQLKQLQPFTSEDIDFKGDQSDVERIGRQLVLTPVFPHKIEMTALSGFFTFTIGNPRYPNRACLHEASRSPAFLLIDQQRWDKALHNRCPTSPM